MKCHNQRVARSRRHAEKKRQAAAAALGAKSGRQEARGASDTPNMDDKSLQNGTSDHSTFSNDVSHLEAHTKPSHAQNEPANTGLQLPAAAGSPVQPVSPTRRPGSAGQGARRPMNAPPPSSLRSLRENAARATPPESTQGDPASRLPLSTSSTNTQLVWPSDSPLMAGVQAAAAARQRPGTADSSPKVLESPRRSERTLPPAVIASSSPKSQGRTDPSNDDEQDAPRTGSESYPWTASQDSNTIEPATPSSPATVLRADKELEKVAEEVAPRNVQYKRASRLSVQKKNGLAAQDEPRMSKSFSFYDPDIVSLMDSFGRAESSDDLTLEVPGARGATRAKSPLGRPSNDSVPSPRRAMDESDRPFFDPNGVVMSENTDEGADREERKSMEPSLPRSASAADKMRQSLQSARDGKIKLDKAMLESLLEEFDSTRDRMKALQKKYDRIRRASQQAAQGFSSAREEYEQELRARYDAEAEMLNLKREVHIQASQLAELTSERRQQEKLHQQTRDIKSSIQSLEKELSKLHIERDVHAAEVAGLISVQEGRTVSGEPYDESLKRGLTSRLDVIKDKYRAELADLLAERDALLAETEDLRQLRDTLGEETQNANARNEELKAALEHIQERLEHAQAAEKLVEAKASASTGASSVSSGNTRSPAHGFGFGFKGKPASSAGSTITALDGSSQGHLADAHEGLAIVAPLPISKVENAAPKKFKWMKGSKLTASDAMRATSHGGLPGVSPPVPPKGVTSHFPSTAPARDHRNAQSHQREQSGAVRQDATLSSVQHHHKSSSDAHGAAPSASYGMPSSSEIVIKEHLFQPFNILRPVRCFSCQKNMWGQSELRCQFCNQACHVRCLHSLPVSCNQPYSRADEAVEPAGPSMFGRRLSDQVRAEGGDRAVPLLVERCVQVVEKQGMDYEGIYRKSGGTSQLKIITQLFEKGQAFDLDDQDRFNDISAITSVLKNYFRELPEPLLTFELYERFIESAESKSMSPESKRSTMRELIHNLPREHFDTLEFFAKHLARVAQRAEENRMNSRNLGVVFGRE